VDTGIQIKPGRARSTRGRWKETGGGKRRMPWHLIHLSAWDGGKEVCGGGTLLKLDQVVYSKNFISFTGIAMKGTELSGRRRSFVEETRRQKPGEEKREREKRTV